MPIDERNLSLWGRPRADVVAEYRRQFPILAAYDAILAERNTHHGPITEPPAPGLPGSEIARLALQRIGRDADELACAMAEAFVQRLHDEIDRVAPDRTLEGLVVGYWLGFGVGVPTSVEWEDMPLDERKDHVREMFDQASRDLTLNALVIAMPMILATVVTSDAMRREGCDLAPAENVVRLASRSDR